MREGRLDAAPVAATASASLAGLEKGEAEKKEEKKAQEPLSTRSPRRAGTSRLGCTRTG